jgi:hypothetical protein
VRAHLTRFERLTSKNGKSRPKLTVRGLEVDREDRRVNPNRVYSKEALFERIWGLEAMGDSDTVVVHMRRLREKIEPEPQNPQYIETVWGAGYRFRV